MDLFDDDLPVARGARAGGKFLPKAKPKPGLQEKVPTSKNEILSKEGKRDGAALPCTVDAKQLNYSSIDCSLAKSAEAPLEAGSDIGGHSLDINTKFELSQCSSQKADYMHFDGDATEDIIPGAVLSDDKERSNVDGQNGFTSDVIVAEKASEHQKGLPSDGNRSMRSGFPSPDPGQDLDLGDTSCVEVMMLRNSVISHPSSQRQRQVDSMEYELDPFSSNSHELVMRNAQAGAKFQPKIKPQPRGAVASAPSSLVTTENTVVSTPPCLDTVDSLCSDDDCNKNLTTFAGIIDSPYKDDSALPFEGAIDDRTGYLHSSTGKLSGGCTDIFSGLEGFEDFLSQAPSGAEKPASGSFNSSVFGISDATQGQPCDDCYTTLGASDIKEPTIIDDNGDTLINNGRLETQYQDVGCSSKTISSGEILDRASMDLDDINPLNQTSEIPIRGELTERDDIPAFDDVDHSQGVPGLHAEVDANVKEKGFTTSNPTEKHRRTCRAVDGNKSHPSRQLRKRAKKLVDEPESEADNDDLAFSADPPHDNEHEEDYASKKRFPRNVRNPEDERGKSAKRRKKGNEACDASTNEPRKKFSHSTRRNRRYLNKALLETPEDEIDPLRLQIKDLIRLAEYRERLAKKDAGASKTSHTNQSGLDSIHQTTAREEENLASEDGRFSDYDDPASHGVPLTPSLFNYRSFLDKAPKGKWSKQDTELFYEAVRQFGTDFSMIQQLFPDKTRHQIKLKFKNEERQRPLLLSDAVHSRSEDHSQFKLVIERLQQASKTEQGSDKDASIGMTGTEEVDNMTPETNEEVAKPEEEVAKPEEDAAVKDQEADLVGHLKSDESDDDFSKWGEYSCY